MATKPIKKTTPVTPNIRDTVTTPKVSGAPITGSAGTPAGTVHSSGPINAARQGTVAERPVQRPVTDNPAPVRRNIVKQPINRSRTPVKQPINRSRTPVKRRVGNIPTPTTPGTIPTPRPVKPKTSKASTDPWNNPW